MHRLSCAANEFGWYASLCFQKWTPYFHIQVAHAGQLSPASRTPPITLGRLKNEVVERKHREAKNIKTSQGAGRGGPPPEVRGVNC